MSRPQKSGIDYFSLDVGFYSDIKIKGLKSRFGADGIAIYIYLLCEIYKDKGYYVIADDDFVDVMSDDLNMNHDKIGQVINFLLIRSLFNDTLYRSDKVLTSAGIQRRFQMAVKSRATKTPIEIKNRFWVLAKSETESFIKVTYFANSSENNPDNSENNPDNSTIYPQSKVKKSKVNESKGYIGGKPPKATTGTFTPPTLKEVSAYCKQRQNNIDPQKFIDYFTASGWIDGKGNPVRSWKQKIITWESNTISKPPQSHASDASFDVDEINEIMKQNTSVSA